MGDKKQTAVDYLVKELSAILGPIKTDPMQDMFLVNAIQKAKAMEEEQHADTWEDSRIMNKGDNYIGKQKQFNEYYNETYKQS